MSFTPLLDPTPMTTPPITPVDRPCAMHVDRCVCFEVTLAELKAYADSHDAGMPELREHFSCGRGCGLCVPYIEEMLRTGRTEIPLHDPASSHRDL